jgi:hypothetical protein
MIRAPPHAPDTAVLYSRTRGVVTNDEAALDAGYSGIDFDFPPREIPVSDVEAKRVEVPLSRQTVEQWHSLRSGARVCSVRSTGYRV